LTSSPAHIFSLSDCFNPACCFYFLCVTFQPTILSSVLTLPYIRQFVYSFCPTLATNFYSSWDECSTNLWILPAFSEPPNMTRDDLTTPVAAAANTQVKLCLYDEEEPHIWFRLIEAQFVAAGIRSKKLKYANAIAQLPKQVLQDILDTLNVCNEYGEPFDYLKNTLLGQFRKSKWQSYFELLCLPMEMQGLKPSVLTGRLKQHLPPGVSPDNDLFLAMFLVRLPPSMCETVGAGNHTTATAMVKAADALWDARGGHDPMVAAAMTR
jgi:hypothetical protein